jgi:hypothetical protein
LDGETDREIRGVSAADSCRDFRGDLERDLDVERQNLWRGDSEGVLRGLFRMHLQSNFRRDSCRDSRGESRREIRISVVNDRFYLPGIEYVGSEVRSFAAADGVKPFWTLLIIWLELQS